MKRAEPEFRFVREHAHIVEIDGQQTEKKPRVELCPFSQFEPESVAPHIELSGKRSQYGVMFTSRLKSGGPFVLLLPRMTIASAPCAWDEGMQAKFGKNKDKQLDPERKTEQWLMKCSCSDEFVKSYFDKITKPLAKRLADQKKEIWPNDVSKHQLDGAQEFYSLINSPFKRDGEKNFIGLDTLGERGNLTRFPVKLIDSATGKELPAGAQLGEGSEVSVAVDFSRGYAGATTGVKNYLKPVVIYVHKLCEPSNVSADDFIVPSQFD